MRALVVQTADTFVKAPSWFKELGIILCASFLISAFALLSIPLPFSPVPLVMQNHVVLFLGVLLGSRRATLATLAFLGQGLCGLPVFAHGTAGIGVLIGPTGGYLMGYVIAAFVTGLIVDLAKNRSSAMNFLAMGIGSLVIYLFGASHLSQFIGFKMALIFGVLPFMPGNVIKLIFFTKALKHMKWLKL